jgi:hypothetical protein
MEPTYNTVAEIKGTEKPEEYVMLSAHFDSWMVQQEQTIMVQELGDDGSYADTEENLS